MIEVIPNWHPVAVHFTVALLITASVLFAAGTLFRKAASGRALTAAARWNLAIGAAVTVATLATAKSVETDANVDDNSAATSTPVNSAVDQDGLDEVERSACPTCGSCSGMFTATESSCVAVVYALLVTALVYRSMSWRDFVHATQQAVRTTAMVLLIIGTAAAFSSDDTAPTIDIESRSARRQDALGAMAWAAPGLGGSRKAM